MRKSRNTTRTQSSGWDSAFNLLNDNPVPGDVAACLDELGCEFRVSYEEIQMKCPAHMRILGKEDRHPSFSVNSIDGVFNCFSCGFKGNFWMLVDEITGWGRDKSMDWVRERGGIERSKKIMRDRHIDSITTVDTSKQINEASLALFVEVPEKVSWTRDIAPESCDHYGVLWDEEHERWIVPIRDPKTGKLWGWQEKNARYFKNLPYNVKKNNTLFGYQQIEEGERTVIVVESPLDVPHLHTCHFENGVATFGTEITNEQLALLFDRFDVIIWAFDNDRPGVKMTKVLLNAYLHESVIQRVFAYDVPWDGPKSEEQDGYVKDPGDMTAEQIQRAVTGAISAVTWLRSHR